MKIDFFKSHLTVLLAVLIPIMAIISLSLGSANVSLWTAIADLIHHRHSLDETVVWQIRFPRVFLAILVGASLGMAGAAMQGLLRNPLADPGILGVTNGAALGAVLTLYFGVAALAWYWLPVMAILGSFVALFAVYLLAGVHGSVYTFMLSGVAINSFAGALIAIALNFAPSFYAMQEIVFWLLGSLANRNWHHVYIATPFILVGMALILISRRYLSGLTLGEQTASTLGFNPIIERYRLFIGVAMAVGASVAVTGSIGFVGLMVPHLLRPLVGQHPGRLLLVSALAGAIFVLAADMVVHQFSQARELKIGVVTSLIGGPFFLMLVLKTRKQWV